MQVGILSGVSVFSRGYSTGRGSHIISQIPNVVGWIDNTVLVAGQPWPSNQLHVTISAWFSRWLGLVMLDYIWPKLDRWWFQRNTQHPWLASLACAQTHSTSLACALSGYYNNGARYALPNFTLVHTSVLRYCIPCYFHGHSQSWSFDKQLKKMQRVTAIIGDQIARWTYDKCIAAY